jgi:hypothetical protein
MQDSLYVEESGAYVMSVVTAGISFRVLGVEALLGACLRLLSAGFDCTVTPNRFFLYRKAQKYP